VDHKEVLVEMMMKASVVVAEALQEAVEDSADLVVTALMLMLKASQIWILEHKWTDKTWLYLKMLVNPSLVIGMDLLQKKKLDFKK